LYSRSVRKELFKKRRLWNKCRSQLDNIIYRILYRECCHNVWHLLRSTEKARELKVINADNLGVFYRSVNHRLTNKSGISPLYDTQGKLVSDNLGKANLLNNYFALVCTNNNSSLPPLYHFTSSCLLSDITFNKENVTSAISKLKSNLSSGSDDLPSLPLKRLCPVLAQLLAILYQQHFSVSYVFPEWNHAIITPVLKNGLALSTANYRLISLTCVTSIICERIIPN